MEFNPCPAEPCLWNSVDPDQLASEEAKWSGSALFAIQYVNFYEQSGSSNLIGWKFEKKVWHHNLLSRAKVEMILVLILYSDLNNVWWDRISICDKQ